MQVAKDQNCFSMLFSVALLLPLSDYRFANSDLAAASLVFDGYDPEDTGKVHHSHFLPGSFYWLCSESVNKYNSSCHSEADTASLQKWENAVSRVSNQFTGRVKVFSGFSNSM